MKKGISLIVLIVTIIVIIILAAAVILTLNRNNPIDSSRVAQLADNRATINSGLQLYFGKVMAQYEGVLENSEVYTGVTDKKKADGTAITGLSAVAKANTKVGTTNYYELDTGVVDSQMDVKVPSIANATWYIDVNSGLVYLVYTGSDKIPAWMFTDSNKTSLDSTLAAFVKVAGTNSIDDYTAPSGN